MATPITIPNVGESVTEATIGSLTVKPGTYVKADDVVLEIETDKVNMEIRSPVAGTVQFTVKPGDTVKIGQTVASVDETAKPSTEAPAAAMSQSSSAPAEAAVRAESSSTTSTATPSGARAATMPRPGSAAGDAHVNGEHRATPLAEKIAQEFGVDLKRVVGTGAGQRIREQDVIAYIQSHKDGPDVTPAATPASASRSAIRERMSPLRQRIAQRLVEAQHTAAMLTTFNEVDMTAVMAMRAKYKDKFEKKHGIGLGFMSFFVKAACSALKAYPAVNAYIVTDEEGRPAVEMHDYCDVSIAVSTPKGLVVPVLRNAEKLGFAEIEKAIKDFAERAKAGKLGLDEITGGTFTITNGGVFGSLMSTPILNPPQSGILGMHAIKNRPVEHPDKPGEIALRPMMYLALSYDHRLVDGAGAVSFLVHIKQCLEDPARMLIDL
ncbi:MAG: 2-oxoglutarate dehydrogenase complex dihydrolipoyllysine-residue succinyltransferase [Phycisphaeraceae bacterium]|nr:2-oxoglutarate dehydrogenase complex dihydrolipoyllysine-residue succinyltransferase [Phycisphaeraceae bacterium]MCW5753512.1 2-oxoglutarate dehydrogenase complex dihydrolipoyllysine-residue succinyltransferase [Phycisphaeraceae bacterium]